MKHRRRIALSLLFACSAGLAACGSDQTVTDAPPTGPSSFLSGDDDRYFNEGVAARSNGDIAEAEQAFRTALIANPRYLAAQLALADLLLAESRPREAAVAYEQAIAIRDRSYEARLGLAKAQLAYGDSVPALENVNAALERIGPYEPASSRARVLCTLSEIYMDQGDTAMALQTATEALEADGTYTPARLLKSMTLVHMLRLREAVQLLAGMEEFEDDPEILVEVGGIYMAAQRFEKAIDSYERALEFAPSMYEAELGLATAELRFNRHQIALERAGDLIERYPDRLDAYAIRARGTLLMTAENADNSAEIALAERDVDYLLSMDATHFDGLLLRGDIERMKGNDDAAERAYIDAQQSNSASIESYERLNTLYSSTENWSAVVALLGGLAESTELTDPLLLSYGSALEETEDLHGATQQLAVLARRVENDHELHFRVASNALLAPDAIPLTDALWHGRMAFERNTGSLDYRVVYIELLALNGDENEANRLFTVAQRAWPRDPKVMRVRRILEDLF